MHQRVFEPAKILTMSETSSLMEFASELVTMAGRLTLEHFQTASLDIEIKGDGSPVTQADTAAETLIRSRIHEAFPHDSVIGEEHDDVVGTSGRRWVIDPIDGTHAFTRGVGLYSNLLYLEDQDGPLIGAINIPAIDELVVAGRDEGCFWNGARCHVSSHVELAGAVVTTSAYDNWTEASLLALRRSGARMRTWGDGYGYVLVATGRAEAMVDPEISFWDVAPMAVIISEAGGTVTQFDGSTALSDTNCIASNTALHDQVLDLVRR